MRASGTFEVKISPQAQDRGEGSTLGRMSLDKEFHGDLEATGKGEMLTAITEVEGSAAYLAMERVTGTLQGRRGSFALQHVGVMTRAGQQLSVSVVPESGAGQLTGLAGTLSIRIEDGRHFYDLDYTLPDGR